SRKAEILREVYERDVNQSRNQLILVFTTKFLVFQVNRDDDTISVFSRGIARFDKRGLSRKSRSRFWKPFIEKSFGWGWATVNQQGYYDGALLSFDDLPPAVFLEVVASSIEISGVIPQEELQYEIKSESILKSEIMDTQSVTRQGQF